MLMIDRNQRKHFKRRGYVVFNNRIDESVIDEARSGVWDALPISHDSSREEMQEQQYKYINEVSNLKPFTEIRDTIYEYAEQLVGQGVLESGEEGIPTGDVNIPKELQIVVNYPQRIKSPDTHLRSIGYGPRGVETTAGGHLDGYGAVFKDPDRERLYNYSTIGVGVYLDEVTIGGGGLTVFPGSHWLAEKYFEEHSLESPGWMGQLPALDDNGGWNYDESLYQQLRPEEITGPSGTIIFWHMKLLHCASVNQSARPRLATFSRFTHKDGDDIEQEAATNIWKYWDNMQDIEIDLDKNPVR